MLDSQDCNYIQQYCKKCDKEEKGEREMKLKSGFDFMFFSVLICLSLSMLYGSWCYLEANKIIKSNQIYSSITIEQERDFNKWDLERNIIFNFSIGIFLFMLILVYLFFSIQIKKEKGE